MLFVVVGVLVLAFGGSDDGLFRLWQKRQELAEAETRIGRLQAENDSLWQVLWRLENDPAYVEKVAREEYGMVKEGERVYRLRTEPSGAATESD